MTLNCRSVKKKFREIVYQKHNLKEKAQSRFLKEKIDQVIEDSYQNYLSLCKLLHGKKIQYIVEYSYIFSKTIKGTNLDNYQYGPLAHNPCLTTRVDKITSLNYQFDGDINPPQHRKIINSCILNLDSSQKMLLKEDNRNADISIIQKGPATFFSNVITDFNNLYETIKDNSLSLYYCEEDINNANAVIYIRYKLLTRISNTDLKDVSSINQVSNINLYDMNYGNNSILLSISKGYNHGNAECKQKDITDALLIRQDLNINCIDLKHGMTPLHIACLRGDSPSLIEKLLQKGADTEALDYEDKKPIDLLQCDYQEVQTIIQNLTGGSTYKFTKNKSITSTLPTEEERKQNIQQIKDLLLQKNKSSILNHYYLLSLLAFTVSAIAVAPVIALNTNNKLIYTLVLLPVIAALSTFIISKSCSKLTEAQLEPIAPINSELHKCSSKKLT